jgi:urease accessory protein
MRLILICLVLAEAFLSPAFAHTGVGRVESFSSGVAHPLSGADHILAMTVVGLWSGLTGGRAVWVWPTTFVAAMLGGFAAARLGLQIPFVEAAISLSIIVFGLLIALGVGVRVWLGGAVVGLFAFFHGHAHGTELAATGAIPYAAGFAFATAALHAAGAGVGLCARSLIARTALRANGGSAALVGSSWMGS